MKSKVEREIERCGLTPSERFFAEKADLGMIWFGKRISRADIRMLATPIAELNNIDPNDRPLYADMQARFCESLNITLKLEVDNNAKQGEITKIKRSLFNTLKIPTEWAVNYQNVYDTSNKVISGVLQNFFC